MFILRRVGTLNINERGIRINDSVGNKAVHL
jgi:hypothetical protein